MKKLIFTFIFATLCGISAFAYDFSAVCSSGQTLYYNITSYAYPYTVKVISQNQNSPFYSSYPTGNLIIPSSVTYNGRTFSVTALANKAFFGCSGLTTVTIPNSVTSIGDLAFRNCSGLTTVTIPNSVTSIGSDAFYNCSGLVSVYYTGTIAEWCGITFGNSWANPLTTAHNLYIDNNLVTDLVIPNTVTEIKDNAFYNASCFASVTIPNSVTSIGRWAFRGCIGLPSVTIPNSITSIDFGAFQDCSGMTSVTIGSGVTSIGYSAFYDCSGLTDIYANPTTPPTVEANSTPPSSYLTGFPTFNNYTATLWAPCESAVAYMQADGWSNFNTIYGNGPALLRVSSANPQMGTVSVIQQPTCTNHISRIAAIPNEGYRFVQWNDGSTSNPYFVYASLDVEYVAFFEAIPTYTITAVSADEEMGTVTGGGDYYEDETVTLTATANDGYTFSSWTDGITDNPRTVTVTGDATYTATFVALHTITVTSADETQGTASGSGDYAEGLEIEISATPAEHYHFAQWNDGNTDNPRTITVTSDSTFTAVFAINQHTVTVVSADTEMGTVSESGTYDYGSEIQISATPADGYGFVAWNDGNTDNPRTIIVTEDITYTATFGTLRTITVLSADETMGTVSGSGIYVEGAQVEISAEAVEHYHFTQWNDGSTDNPRTITVAGDSTFTASFAIDRFTITVESADETMGTVSESNTYDYGTEMQISATASEHYHFVQWNDGNTDNPRTITVTEDATYRAEFAIDRFTITGESADEAMGTVSEGGTYDYGSEIQISATARDGYQFVSWGDGNTDNPRTITIVTDATYIASFVSVVGIEEASALEVNLFPNPATDILNITSSETISEIEIVNTLGQVVKRIEVNADNAVCDVEELKAGVYVVKVSTLSLSKGANVSQRKFIKE
ncbi:MAG: leucine-rich repeat protein [Bacteroidales bacterium]|nr:leucine-rich repeat protein [Bacteroidales bacterium]